MKNRRKDSLQFTHSHFFLALFMMFWMINCGPGEEPNQPQGSCSPATAQKLSDHMTAPTTIKDCVLITKMLDLKSDVTIEPGTTLFFASNAGFNVASTGSLNAVGTAEKNILMQGEQAQPGTWTGFLFGSKSAKNKLQFVHIQHAGSSDFIGFHELSAIVLVAGSALDISDSIIENNAGAVLSIQGGELRSFSNNQVQKNASVAHIPPSLMHAFDGSNKFSQNQKNVIQVSGGDISKPLTVQTSAIPFLFAKTISIQADVKIAPGVTWIFSQDAGAMIEKDGSLHAKGTADKKIRFVGEEDGEGHWKGIWIKSKKKANDWAYVEMSGGGSTEFLGMQRANIVLGENALLTLRNSTISRSGGYGIFITGVGITVAFECSKNTYRDNTKAPLYIPAQLMGQMDPTSDYKQDKEPFVAVDGDRNINKPITIQALPAPYRMLTNVVFNAPVTVESGAHLTFAQDVGIQVKKGGSLKALGAKDKRIVFEGAEDVQGYWKGLSFESNSADNQLRYVDVSHGGSSEFLGLESANVSLYKGSQAVLQDLGLSDSGGWGVFAEGGAKIKVAGCVYKRNKEGEYNQDKP